MNPKNPLDLAKAHMNKATALLWLDRNNEAFDAATDVIILNPNHDDLVRSAHEVRLWALWKADGSPEDMIAEATTVIDLAPDDVQTLAGAHFFRAVSFGLLGLTAEAEPDLRTVIELLPTDHQWSQDAQDSLATATQ